MSDSLSMGFSRSNLNQDVTRIVAEQGKLNYPQVLNSCYPARSITPGRYKNSHTCAKRVKCVYVGPSDKVPVQCPKGYDLLAVFGIGFTRRETEDVSENLLSKKVSSNVILGIPSQPLQGSAQLKEISALDFLSIHEPYSLKGTAQELLKSRRKMVRTQLLERIKPMLTPNNFKWIYRGKEFEGSISENRGDFFSDILDAMYSKALKASSCGSRAERAEAVSILLDTKTPLRFSIFDIHGGYRVISELLAKNGIIKPCAGNANIFETARVISSASAKKIWEDLVDCLIGSGIEENKVSFAELYTKFSKVPYGIDASHLDILIAAAMRLLNPSLSLVKEGSELEFTADSLKTAKAFSTAVFIKYCPQAPYGSTDSLKAVWETFGQPKASAVKRDIWQYTKDSLKNWYAGLNPLISAFAPEENTPSFVVKELIEKECESARDFICSGLIEKAGFTCLPEGDDCVRFAAWLAEAKKGFENYEASFRRSLAERAAVQFGGNIEGIESEEEYISVLNSLFRCWFKRLYPQSAVQNLDVASRALVEMYAEHEDADADYWFEILPQYLGLAPLSKWHSDNSVVFSARLARACQDLELWHIERLFRKLEEAGDKKESDAVLRNWVRSVMNGADLNSDERSSVLLDLLEKFCWTAE